MNWVLIAGLLFAYISPHVNPSKTWIFSIFGLLYPILFILNIGFILVWIVLDYKKIIYSLLTLIIGLPYIQGLVGFHYSTTETKDDITVMSYNIKHLSGLKKMDLDHFRQFLKNHEEVDVFCFQESSVRVKKILREVFPGFQMAEVKNGTLIYSKYPIVKWEEIDFGTTINSCIWADLKIRNDTLRIYTTHLLSNNLPMRKIESITPANIQEKKNWKPIKTSIKRYVKTSKTRASQAQKVKNHINRCPYNVIICGDFNEGPLSYTYNLLADGLCDAFEEKGRFVSTTYAGKLPFLRIDYILHDRDLIATGFDVIHVRYSDHFPIKASFKPNPKGF